jgi:dienelactone hydrolase
MPWKEAERIKSLLLLPKSTGGTAPAVIAHHQHAGQFDLGKCEVVGLAGDADQAYGAELAKRGYVVIAPDALAFEERNWSAIAGQAEYYELASAFPPLLRAPRRVQIQTDPRYTLSASAFPLARLCTIKP